MTATRIEARAILGDTLSAALVTPDGEIDWWCAPRFDSPPVFDKLVEPQGAAFSLHPAEREDSTLAYVDGTLVARTTWSSEHAELVVHDWMPFPPNGHTTLYRLARATRGEVALRVGMSARGRIHLATTPNVPRSKPPFDIHLFHDKVAAFRISPQPNERGVTPREAERSLEATIDAWRSWLATTEPTPTPKVARSLLTLKALTYAPTGAIVAAPTTSLPEVVGGERNWDYRYAWIRDSALCAGAFAAWGHLDEARRLGEWVLRTVGRHPDALHALYTIDGEHAPDEEATSLRGYLDSRPVRFGNGAVKQIQHDAYGHAIECLHHCGALSDAAHGSHAETVRMLADGAARAWRRPDNGIWELPAGPRPFTYSRMMCWLALDQAVRLAEHAALPGPIEAWRAERDAIARSVREDAAGAGSGALTQAEGDPAMDAANLRAGIIGFLPPDDPLMVATIERVRAELEEAPGILRRYRTPDGLPGEEGAFLACGFWLVEALHLSGQATQAERTMRELESLSGPLGLFAEEYDARARHHLGNYPQAIVHAAHAKAAATLRRGAE